MEYEEFINLINGDRFSYALFEVSGYAHYKHCEIRKFKPSYLGGDHKIVDVSLSNRSSEKVSFLDTFKEEYKLFFLGRKLGTQTLKQVWNRIVIHEIKE